ncbi:MAG: response regulator [Alphaproteobacteria bacterium]|nr:MAG: response regulator [Alphaproteobacteria bacterium]
MKVLIVDDDNMIREIMKKTLTAAGFDVTESGNGNDALRKLQSQRFDIVVTDNVMPRGGSAPIASYIRTEDPMLPLLVVSSGMSDAELETDNILYKPFKRQELIEAVRQTLEKAGRILPP